MIRRTLVALWVERRRRKRFEREAARWWIATLGLLSLYLRYGTDEQVDDMYAIIRPSASTADQCGHAIPW